MRRKISDIYSKAFPKKGGEEYSSKELVRIFAFWITLLVLLFVVVKFAMEKLHFFDMLP